MLLTGSGAYISGWLSSVMWKEIGSPCFVPTRTPQVALEDTPADGAYRLMPEATIIVKSGPWIVCATHCANSARMSGFGFVGFSESASPFLGFGALTDVLIAMVLATDRVNGSAA